MLKAVYENEWKVWGDFANGRGPIHEERGWFYSGKRKIWVFEQDENGMRVFGYNNTKYLNDLNIGKAWGMKGMVMILVEQTHTSMGRCQEMVWGYDTGFIGLERLKAAAVI